MNITKSQSKQLRYMCGVVDYNQPCTRKYTGTPEGKLREIGRFKYLENGGDLKSFTFDGGDPINLDGITFDILLDCIATFGLDPIQVPAPTEPKKPSDIEDAVAVALTGAEPETAAHLDEASGNDVHPVNVPVTVEAAAPTEQPVDDWCTPENVSDWQEPDELEKVKEAEARKKLEGERAPADPPKVEPPPVIPTELVTRDAFENAIRETAMNAAAREALYLCNIECGPAYQDAATIIRANTTAPHFLDTYSKCLERVGIPHSIEEIVTALPNQEKWLRSLAINTWKIKD